MKQNWKKIFAMIICFCTIVLMMPGVEVHASGNPISKCSITLSKTKYNYTGKAIKPSVTVKYKKTVLKKDKDYTVKYANNTNTGTATVTVKGKGKYTGSVKKKFKIVNALTVTISKKTYDYTGKDIKPAVSVKYGKKVLTSKEYTVSYKNNKEVGTASIIVKGKGQYKGKNAYITFKILESIDNGPLEIEEKQGLLLAGESYKIKVLKCSGQLMFNSSDNNVAFVDADGTIKAFREGNVKITVSDSKNSAYIDLKVVEFDFSSRGERLRPGSTKQVSIIRGAGAAEYTWESDNPEVATVDKNGLITAIFGKGGKANIYLAVKTLNGISHSPSIVIEVPSIEDSYTVKKTGSTYAVAKGNVSSPFIDGQSADINLLEGGLTTAGCNGDGYWHNSGLSTVHYKGYNYYFVSDTWNNRVLVYKVLDSQVWGYDRHSALTDLYCILGQTSSDSIKAGYKLNELNWPIEAAVTIVDDQLKVFVTDANNNRILAWDNLFAMESKMTAVNGVYYGPAADYSIMEKCDVKNVALGTGNLANTKLVNSQEAGIKWPWAIWTDGKRLICTSTQDGNLLIWDELPSITDKYPDKVISMGGTIRTIACKDNYLLLGDHNIDTGSRNIQGLKILYDYEKLPYINVTNKNDGTDLFKYAQIGNGDGNNGYTYYEVDGHQPSGTFLTKDLLLDNGTCLSAGTLLLNVVGSIEVRTDGRIDGNTDKPDYYIGGGVVGETRLFRFTSADYAPVLIDANGSMYVSMGNTGIIVGYRSGTIPSEPADISQNIIDSQDGDDFLYNGQFYSVKRDSGQVEKHCAAFPNVWLGSKNATDDAYKETYRYQNSMISSDGKHLVASSDHGTGSVLALWRNIPDGSNAVPDTIYTFTIEDVMNDTVLYDDGSKTILMAGGRHSLFIWNDIDTAINGGAPDSYYREMVGNVRVNEIESFAYDGTYFYLCDSNGVYIFDGFPKDEQAPVSTLNYRNGHINVTNCNDGETYIGLANVTSDEREGGARIYTRTEALKNGNYFYLKGAVRESVRGLEGDTIGGNKRTPEKEDRASFNGVSDILITKEGKVIVSDTGFFRVIIWDSIQEAVNEGITNVRSSSTVVLGYGSDYYDRWDVLKADPSNYYYMIATDEVSMESPTTLFRPTSIAYDGNYLWIGDFKFSGGIKRFSGKF